MAVTGRLSRGLPLLCCAAVLLVAAGCARPATGTAAGTTSGPVLTGPISTASAFTEPPSVAPATGTPDGSSTAAALPDCAPGGLATRTAGVLTLATGLHPSPPWFTGPDPATSDGYEAAVARQAAATLGYPTDRIAWVQVDTQRALDGATGGFDVLVDQVREPESGSDVLDFSTGYYAITDALVMPKSVVDSLAGTRPDLTRLRVGVIDRTTGKDSARQNGIPDPIVFPSSTAGVAAVTGGAVDAVILPTPDALAASRTGSNLSVVGQLPPGRWQPDQFHLVLAKNSPLTPCVTAAVDRLRIEGALDTLTQQWITGPLAPLLG